MRPLLLVRPEPGLSASAERARQMGLDVITCPLFRVEPLAWRVPDLTNYDALVVTSANAIRQGGRQLDMLRHLSVHAVGSATAEAAQQAGFSIASVGHGNAQQLIDTLPSRSRMLHLAGEEHREIEGVDALPVYRAATIADPALPLLAGTVVAVHSPRAGSRLSELASDREQTAIAAISPAAAEACGPGWQSVERSPRPDDASLLALAAMLCHTSVPR